jgi:hypothetical protein
MALILTWTAVLKRTNKLYAILLRKNCGHISQLPCMHDGGAGTGRVEIMTTLSLLA